MITGGFVALLAGASGDGGFQGLRILTFRAEECKAFDRKTLAGIGGRHYDARLQF
ncbi:hypothetical protein D3C80_2033390 [compost metagenome]